MTKLEDEKIWILSALAAFGERHIGENMLKYVTAVSLPSFCSARDACHEGDVSVFVFAMFLYYAYF